MTMSVLGCRSVESLSKIQHPGPPRLAPGRQQGSNQLRVLRGSAQCRKCACRFPLRVSKTAPAHRQPRAPGRYTQMSALAIRMEPGGLHGGL